MTTITKERLEELANFRGAPVTNAEEREMARMLLAGMDQVPDFLLNNFLSRLQRFLDEGDFVGDERGVISGAIGCGKEILSNYAATKLSGNSEQVGWIKCSERMPDVDLNYSAEFLCSNGYAVFTAACRCELMQDGSTHKYFSCSWADVEYWMPLPAAPKEDQS